jgi:hypothetical protein
MFRLAFLAIAIMILIPSGLSGCIVGAKIGDSITPHIVYDYDYVRSENIKVIDFEDGRYIFSNGEKVRIPNSFILQLYTGFGYLSGGAVFFFPGLYLAKQVTRKYAPRVYDLLMNKRT